MCAAQDEPLTGQSGRTTGDEPVHFSGRYGSVGEGLDRTCWPIVDHDLAWALRYGSDGVPLNAKDRLYLADVLGAYTYLTDPTRSQRDALDSLKRVRRVRSEEQRP